MVSKVFERQTPGQANLVSRGLKLHNFFALLTVCYLTVLHYKSCLHSSEFRCKCGYCKTERLSNALEFRCCNEVKAAIAKLTFEGIEGNCILQHTDFDALTNASVLEQVCPLMKDRKGRSYKFPSRGTRSAKNE